MRKITLCVLLTCVYAFLHGQNFHVPANYKFEKAEDFATYEGDVVAAINWIQETPLGDDAQKRKEINAFLLQWMSGSPTVHLEINERIVTFMGTPDLLMIFMGGWTKYSLESKDFNNKVAGTLAGIEAVMAFYTKNRSMLKKDKNVEKYIKMKQDGSLKDYVDKNA